MHRVTANTPLQICSSYRCAVMQHQSTAALVRAEQLPHCSVLLCKTGSQQALGHCKYTYADLLFIQVCSDATPKHCSTGQGRIAFPLFSAHLSICAPVVIISQRGEAESPMSCLGMKGWQVTAECCHTACSISTRQTASSKSRSCDSMRLYYPSSPLCSCTLSGCGTPFASVSRC